MVERILMSYVFETECYMFTLSFLTKGMSRSKIELTSEVCLLNLLKYLISFFGS